MLLLPLLLLLVPLVVPVVDGQGLLVRPAPPRAAAPATAAPARRGSGVRGWARTPLQWRSEGCRTSPRSGRWCAGGEGNTGTPEEAGDPSHPTHPPHPPPTPSAEPSASQSPALPTESVQGPGQIHPSMNLFQPFDRHAPARPRPGEALDGSAKGNATIPPSAGDQAILDLLERVSHLSRAAHAPHKVHDSCSLPAMIAPPSYSLDYLGDAHCEDFLVDMQRHPKLAAFLAFSAFANLALVTEALGWQGTGSIVDFSRSPELLPPTLQQDKQLLAFLARFAGLLEGPFVRHYLRNLERALDEHMRQVWEREVWTPQTATPPHTLGVVNVLYTLLQQYTNLLKQLEAAEEDSLSRHTEFILQQVRELYHRNLEFLVDGNAAHPVSYSPVEPWLATTRLHFPDHTVRFGEWVRRRCQRVLEAFALRIVPPALVPGAVKQRVLANREQARHAGELERTLMYHGALRASLDRVDYYRKALVELHLPGQLGEAFLFDPDLVVPARMDSGTSALARRMWARTYPLIHMFLRAVSQDVRFPNHRPGHEGVVVRPVLRDEEDALRKCVYAAFMDQMGQAHERLGDLDPRKPGPTESTRLDLERWLAAVRREGEVLATLYGGMPAFQSYDMHRKCLQVVEYHFWRLTGQHSWSEGEGWAV
jgi:hypothetical protein